MDNNIEVWENIPPFEGKYQVSNLGRVRRMPYFSLVDNHITWQYNTHILRQHMRCGYPTIYLSDIHISFGVSTHRVVAYIFIPNPDNLPCVNHIDGNKTNNSVSNLEWVSHRENVSHSKLRVPGRKSRFIGVTKVRRSVGKNWCATLVLKALVVYKEYFYNELDAARAYILKMKEHGIINKYAENNVEKYSNVIVDDNKLPVDIFTGDNCPVNIFNSIGGESFNDYCYNCKRSRRHKLYNDMVICGKCLGLPIETFNKYIK